MNVYEIGNLAEKLANNTYPGRGIVLGISPDGKTAVSAYFIMGRSVNSRNRVFIQEPDGIRTEAHDPSLMVDPHLIIYHPVRQIMDLMAKPVMMKIWSLMQGLRNRLNSLKNCLILKTDISIKTVIR